MTAHARIEPMSRTSETTQAAAVAAREMMERAGAHARRRALDAAAGVRRLRRQAGDRLATSTGRTLDTWVGDTHAYLKTRPLQVLAVTVGVGYVLGKLLRR